MLLVPKISHQWFNIDKLMFAVLNYYFYLLNIPNRIFFTGAGFGFFIILSCSLNHKNEFKY